MNPRIAVVVPAFNAAPFLTETLRSVQAQTVSEWEMIIVDDGSTDDTARIAQEFADGDERIRMVRQPNGGVSRARNRGLEEMGSDAESVAFLDADDLWEPDALHTLWDALHACPGAAGAHGVARFVDAQGRPMRAGEHESYARHRRAFVNGAFMPCPPAAPTTFATLLCQNCVPASGVLLRREAVQEVVTQMGGFDPSLSPAEDWDFWLRVSARAPLTFADTVVYNYRQHAANASGQWRKMRTAQRRVRRKAATCVAFSPVQRTQAAQALRLAEQEQARAFWELAAQQTRHGGVFPAVKLLRQALISAFYSVLPPAKV